MELEHILDIRDSENLSHIYISICCNARKAASEYILTLKPEAYQRFTVLNNFREDILRYLLKSERVNANVYTYLTDNSYDYICKRTENLIPLVDILKE